MCIRDSTIGDGAIHVSGVLGFQHFSGEGAHRVADNEDLLALVLCLGGHENMVDVINKVVEGVDVTFLGLGVGFD